ncbi:mitoferrin-1 isoform X2 [Lithobates pipiens]
MDLRSAGLAMEARDGVAALPGEGEDYESLPPGVSPLTHMTAGAVAGILEHTVMYPVDSVKTRMQSLQPDPKAQYKGVMEALKRMVRTEGLFTPLRGINVTMLGAGPAHALYFACYEKMKTTVGSMINHAGNSHLANGVAGSLATVLHDAIMNPAEDLSCQNQDPTSTLLHDQREFLKRSEKKAVDLSVWRWLKRYF